ncbi:MAG: hypothetical protein RLZ37_2233 [Actinomycetota bacterium]|jgi:hypothetical protein
MQSVGESSCDRRCITFRDDDDEMRIHRSEPGTGVSRSRDDIEVDARRKDCDQRFAIRCLTESGARRRILEVDARRRRCDSTKMHGTDFRGIRDDPAAQSSLGSKPIERVRIGTHSTMVSDDIDDSLERFMQWSPTMELCECFTIMDPDTDFESRLTGRFVIDDSTDFESDDFSADDPVLDHDIGSAVEDHRTEFQVRTPRFQFRYVIMRNSAGKRTASDLPHPDVDREVGRPTCKNSRVLADEQVQCAGIALLHPSETHPQGSFVPTLDDNPRVGPDENRCTDSDVDRLGDLDCVRRFERVRQIGKTDATGRQVIANESPQLETV